MEALSRILLLIERAGPVHLGVAKGLVLARHTGASLDLYLCDTEPYQDISAGSARALALARGTCLARGQAYLRSLQQGILCSDVPIHAEAACAASLARGLAERLARAPAHLIIRAVGTNTSVNSWEWGLLGKVLIPMLITRGRPWGPAPRFAAIFDMAKSRDGAACARLTQLCNLLSRRCGARVDLVPRSPGEFIGRIARCDYDLIAVEQPRDSTPREAPDGIANGLLRATAADMLFIRTDAAETADAPVRAAG